VESEPMLKTINNIYLIISILLYSILAQDSSTKYLLISFLSIYSFLSYFAVLSLNNSDFNSHTKSVLAMEVFVYSFIFVAAFNYISYFYNNNFFVFSESDAMGYHKYAKLMVNMSSLGESIEFYLEYWDPDDLGMVMLLYPLYLLSESNLMLNVFYLFIGVITALSLFSISQHFMTKKYAFLSALAYSLSSFVLFFHSIGMKESFMIMLVVLSFDFYYRFIESKSIFHLTAMIVFMGLLFFFRPAIPVIVVVSIVLGFILSKKGGVIFILVSIILMSDLILNATSVYTAGGIDTLIEIRRLQGMIIGGVPFTYAVNILSQSVGPLPTLLSEAAIPTFYGPGLIYRILLAFPFWLGVIYIYSTKNYKLYPLTIFIVMEMASLIFILDGFELRKGLPHIPFVFVIAFWFLDKYDRKIIHFKNKKRFRIFFNFSMFFFTLIIFYWNFR
ncbi:hypothetical protein GSY74_09080, partial [Sulfurovum sp. bin170]|uniref:hypothetical protein n=1 Tax=Sulfurovum sp. bin170 TaxID=2695268 RepID=UPI0013DF931B